MSDEKAAYEWATACLDCGDGPRLHPTEDDARRCHNEDVRGESDVAPQRRHRLRLMRRSVEWEDVTPDA